ncbi:thioredoxin [Leptothermofonsia sichuanensis E412]|uniref:thioredoxin n=1 Tax=Leptothermofonsia sichuanensis TaxID=2917832 RepID=UPI001CA718B0|nr:thioredoxin [Leptothermofonsia sichuanensis]QZZ20704.1 thioredoxin [Leptothermofonsia sichuanensis E412]
MSSVQVITDAEFETEVLKADKPVLAYFWASWCGPCRLMAPIVDGLAEAYGDRIKVVKLEVDPNPEAVNQCQVEGVPALRLFKQGTLVESREGAINKQKLEAIVNPHL